MDGARRAELRNRSSGLIVITVLLAVLVLAHGRARAEGNVGLTFPLFRYLTGNPTGKMVAYSPSELDPRSPGNHDFLTTGSIRTDLKVLRPVFDGLVLYGYNESSTPRILAVAKELKYRAVLIGIWQPKSDAEIDGVAELIGRYHKDLALGVIVGNEGITFDRYGPDDLTTAAARLRGKIPKTIPLTTSEPLAGYRSEAVRQFGDFLAPNIHPVFDAPHLNAAQAAAWARDRAAELAKQANKPLLLKETGFPHGGKESYTPKTQKAFWESYLKPGILARLDDSPDIWIFHGVAFEAFDLAWKAEASNLPIEEYWGLLSTNRKIHAAVLAWQADAERR